MPAGRPRAFDRDEALGKALLVFWERGYQDASVSELTAALGIGAPSLYAAFGSKAGLFCEVADRYQRQDGAAAAAALELAPTAREAVESLLRANVELFTRAGRPHGCLLTKAVSTAPPEDEQVRRYLDRSVRDRVKALERRLARGAAAGERLPAPARDLAGFYDTVVQGLAVRAQEGASRRSLLAAVELAMAAWDAEARR